MDKKDFTAEQVRYFLDHRAWLYKKAESFGIPDYMQTGIVEYIMEARPVGHFLTAVIENNLRAAVNRGDDVNQQALPNYVKFLHNAAPHLCWGSEGSTTLWRERGGFIGVMLVQFERDPNFHPVPRTE